MFIVNSVHRLLVTSEVVQSIEDLFFERCSVDSRNELHKMYVECGYFHILRYFQSAVTIQIRLLLSTIDEN